MKQQNSSQHHHKQGLVGIRNNKLQISWQQTLRILELEDISNLFIYSFIFSNFLAFCQVSLFQTVNGAVERVQRPKFEL